MTKSKLLRLQHPMAADAVATACDDGVEPIRTSPVVSFNQISRRAITVGVVFGLLGWVILFLVLALLAALFGFGDIARAATEIAQILFFILLGLSTGALIFGC